MKTPDYQVAEALSDITAKIESEDLLTPLYDKKQSKITVEGENYTAEFGHSSILDSIEMVDEISFVLTDGTSVDGVITPLRAKLDAPYGVYAYDVRYTDDGSMYGTIEKGDVIVNHAGTFFTETPIDFGDRDCVEIDNSDCEPDIYQWMYGYSDEDLNGYEIVCWPESQHCMEQRGFYQNAYLINDEEGLDKYGSAAYVVDKAWLEEHE